MKISFDTSVLVSALVKELPDHRRALDCLKRHIEDGDECCCSTHSLAECYSALTTIPLPQRIQDLKHYQRLDTAGVDVVSP